jgi:molybdate transport system ATP-binding protein
MSAVELEAHVEVERSGFRLDAQVRAGPGEILAIMGPSGAGKSTLLGAIAGLLRLRGGHVRIDGTDVAGPRPVPPQRRGVVLLGQDPRLFPHLSAISNIAFGLRAHGADRAAALREAGEWLRRVGLDGLQRRRPSELSGGQQQRVALARALATSPRVLLLDEPLTALDPETASEIRRVLGEQLRRADVTTLVVTHAAVDAAALADRLLILDGGTVSQVGPVHEVLLTPATRFAAAVAGTNRLVGVAEGGRWVTTVGRAGISIAAADTDSFTAAARDGTPLAAFIRPEAIRIAPADGATPAAPGEWDARIVRLEQAPAGVRVHAADPPLVVDVPVSTIAAGGLEPGALVRVRVAPADVRFAPVRRGDTSTE